MTVGDVAARDGARIDVGIRPKHLMRTEIGQGQFAATVDVVEPLGSDMIAICQFGDHELSVRVDPWAR